MRSLFKRSIAMLLFLALILPYCNVLPMASAVTENWKFHGDYTDVAVIKDSNSSPSMQGLAVGSQMLYAIKIKTDNSRAVITMTDKDSGTTTTLKDASTGYSYFTGLDHANDMAVWGIDGSSHIFVATTLKGSNAIVRYRRSGSNLYKVATYHLKCNGSDICATAMDVMNVDSSGNIHLITKWGQDIYTGTVHKDTGDTTVNMTKICTISKDMAYIRGEKLNLSEWTNQGFGYYDNTLFVPLSGPQEGANIALHRSVVLVYNLDNVPQGATIYPTDYLAFRVTSEYYSALFEIESVDICSSDGKLYFNTNRRRSNSDTNHDGISSFDEYTYTKPAAASFDAVKHFNAKFLPNGGSGTMEVQRINNGISTPLSKNLYTKPGYTFVGWTAHRLAQNQWYYCTDRSTTGWYAEGKQPSGYSLYIYYDQQKVSATSNVHADTVEYVAQWTPTNYTVKFDANGGTGSVSDMTFTVEQTKTLPANAFTKTGYTFKGWQISGQSTILQPGTPAAELAKYVGTDSSITLVANWEANNYTVTWNVDGQKYATTNVAYGQPITAPSYTAPEGYTFSGWTVPATMPAKDLTLDATLTVNKYTITFKDEDGDVLKSGKVAYGEMPTAPADPTKKPDGHYTYSFAGWTPEITKVTGEATYTATYKETENSYYIVGSMNNWTAAEDNKMSRVTDDVYSLTMALPKGTYQYKANIGNWDICWPGGDNQTIEVPYDTEVTFTLNRLTGELTAKYALKIALAGDFNNWNQQAYMTDNGDGTYTSVLDLTAKTYQFKIIDETVWKGNNGTIVDTTTTTSAVGWVMDQNQNNCKLKASGGTYTFTYNTNTDSLVITHEPAKYTITFVDDDGNELSEQTVTAGQMPKIPADPTKDETAEYTYEFTGWTPEIVAATGDATYTAQFKATPKSYTITYMVDGVKVHEDTYAYGANVTVWSYTAAEGYTFSGWDTEIPATMPAENLTITGTTSIKSYTITYMVDGVKVHEDTYAYGANVTAWSYTPDEGYTFSGWDAEIPATMPAENLTLDATLTVNSYTVTFKVDGEFYKTASFEYGAAVEAPDYDAPVGYNFSGWTLPETMPAEDITLNATLTPKTYTVTWLDEAENVFATETVKHGENAINVPDVPKKEGYTGVWSADAVNVTSDLTIEPVYTAVEYTLILLPGEGAEGERVTKTFTIESEDTFPSMELSFTKLGHSQNYWWLSGKETGNMNDVIGIRYHYKDLIQFADENNSVTLVARWLIGRYRVSVMRKPGEVVVRTDINYQTPLAEVETMIVRQWGDSLAWEGHTLTGWKWFEDEARTKAYTGTTMPAYALYAAAQWEANTYTVTWMVDGQEYSKTEVKCDDPIVKPADPAKEQEGCTVYTFTGWAEEIPDVMPAKDLTFTGSITEKIEHVNIHLEGYKAPTCTEDGYSGDTYCVCGECLGSGVTLPATGHSGIYYFNGNRRSDTESILILVFYCQTCKLEVHQQSRYVTGEIVQEATCTSIGKIDYTFDFSETLMIDHVSWDNFEYDGFAWATVELSWDPETKIAEARVNNPQNKDNHSSTEVTYKNITETTHDVYHACCDTLKEEGAAHDYTHDAEKHICACDAVEQITVRVFWNGADQDPMCTLVEDYGTTTAIPTGDAPTGYHFVGFAKTEGGEVFLENPEYTFTESIDLYPVFQENTYTVTFTVEGESFATTEATFGQAIPLPQEEPEKEGYRFNGWLNVPETMPANENLTIEADFIEQVTITYLSYDIDKMEYVVDWDLDCDKGATITLGYYYWNYSNSLGWDTNDDGVVDHEYNSEYTVTEDVTMKPVLVPFYVDLDLGAEDAVYVDAKGNDITRIYMNGVYDNTATVTNHPTRPGYTFKGWKLTHYYYGSSECLTYTNEKTGKQEISLVLGTNYEGTAIWEAIDYTLTFTINGEVYGESQTFHYGDAIEAPQYTVPEGHTFSGWTLPETMPAEDITLDAALTVNSYTVTFKVDGEFYKTASFEYGAAVEAPDYDAPVGYNFSGWTLPETMPAEDITLNATLTPKTYTVTWLDEAENVFATETVKHGENAINVPDVPEKEGYTGAWSADAVNVTSDLTIKPVYTAVEYTLILLPGEGAEGERVTKTFTIELDESIPDDENSFSKVGHYQNYWWLSGKETGNMNDIIGSEYHYKDLVQFSDENNTVTLVARWNRMFYSTYVLLPDDTVDRHDLTYGKPLAEQEAFFERVLRDKLIRDGYTFTGWKWYEDVAETKVYTGTTMPAYSLYAVAQWEANTYTVTWYYGEGEQLQETYAYGATVNGFIPERFCIDTKTHRGWFDHDWWYIQGNTSDRIELPFTMPAENLEICSATKFTGWMGGPDQSFFNYNIDYSSLSGWFCVNDKNELVTDGSGEWYYAGSDCNVVCGVNRAPYPTQLGYGPDQGDPDQSNSLFIFDENGVFQSEYTGLCELDGKTAYAVNGELPWYAGLVEVDGEYYYFGEDRTMVKGQNLELDKTNDMIFDNGAAAVKSGTYTFDENGKLCKYDGIVRIDGKLFEYEDYRLIREIKAKLCFASLSLNGNIAINYYMLLSDEVLNDDTAYMQFTLVDGEVIQIPVSQGVETLYEGETYYRFSCMVNAKEMTDDIISQFFYEDGSTAEYTYNVQTYAKYILENSEDADMKELAKAMLHYGGASQIHFGYNTEDLANAGMEETDYANVTIDGFETVTGQGTDLVKFYASSLLLKSETTLRFFFNVDSSVENLTVTFNGQALEIKQRSGLYYADVVGIAAKDLDENVTVTISDGTNTADVTFNPMAYCQLVQNDTAGTFSQNMKIVAKALYLYNLAANKYFKEN